MTKLSTMGTSSCATIAIQGFKDTDREMNEAFKEDPSSHKTPDCSVQWFYDKVLMPFEQEPGRTEDYPFLKLMKEIDQTRMEDKFIIITLNEAQHKRNSRYWPKELEAQGFELIDKTDNKHHGAMCYVYVRNNNRPNNVEVGQL